MIDTKQDVKLMYCTPLYLIAKAIRYSHATWDKSDSRVINMIDENGAVVNKLYELGEEDFNLIKRIGFKRKHESVLEHSLIIFHLKLSQKSLLEATRHRVGVSWTVTSSRYALRKINIELEPTGECLIDKSMKLIKDNIEEFLYEGYSLDDVSKMLPQSFLYTAQVSFNLRSLLHFLRLRLSKDAHRDIRIIALKMVEGLPDDYFNLILEDDNIRRKYEKTKEWFYNS